MTEGLPLDLLLLVTFAFTLAGLIKGIIGFGLPTVILALLTATIGLKEAMITLIVPCIVANCYQALAGDHLGALLRRLRTLLIAMCVTTLVGAHWHAAVDARWLVCLLGVLLCLYSFMSLRTVVIPPPGTREPIASPAIGLVTGVLNGLTGSFVIPGVLYLQALGLSRDELIQAMGILFVISTVALGTSMQATGLMDREFALWSAYAVIPALVGMRIGLAVRRRLNERQFRQVFFTSLSVFGLYLTLSPFLR